MMRIFKRLGSGVLRASVLANLLLLGGSVCWGDLLGDLAKPHEGRSMRATSTRKIGADGKPDPNGVPDPNSNWDNISVAPGQRKCCWTTRGRASSRTSGSRSSGPSRRTGPQKGSANHQEMLLRIYWDGDERPAVEAPVGDFFANCFGKRSEVISLPVVVEDADSYNCFWHMPFRKSARIEIVNQSDKPISLLYYNIDWIKKDTLPEDTPYFYAQYRQEYPVENGQGLRGPRDRRARGTTSARCWPCARAARRGSARATRRSTSTARRSPRSGAPAPRTTSSRPGA